MMSKAPATKETLGFIKIENFDTSKDIIKKVKRKKSEKKILKTGEHTMGLYLKYIKRKWKWKSLSHIWLFVTPWTV